MAKAKKAKQKPKSKSQPKTKAKKVAASKTSVVKKSAVKKAAPKKAAAHKAATKKSGKAKAAKPAKATSKKTAKATAAKTTKAPTSAKTPAKQAKWNLAPLADRLVIQVEGPSEKTAGGLYIPASVEDRPHQGKVLAVGPGSKSRKGLLKPLDVRAGDKVLFNSFAGTQTTIDGTEVLILREEDVLGVVEK